MKNNRTDTALLTCHVLHTKLAETITFTTRTHTVIDLLQRDSSCNNLLNNGQSWIRNGLNKLCSYPMGKLSVL